MRRIDPRASFEDIERAALAGAEALRRRGRAYDYAARFSFSVAVAARNLQS